MADAFAFKPAREAATGGTPLLIGLTGPSGGGKTKTALLLAEGIRSVFGGKIVAIDTEARRMLRYANEHDFEYLEFKEPFSSERYAEALKAAAALQDVRTIIVDSMSHEHEGLGGYIDFHERELDRLTPEDKRNDWRERDKRNFMAWKNPAGHRRALINTVLQIPCNFIFCFRGKEKLALVKRTERNEQSGREYTKTEPVEMGFQPIAGDEFVYEMTTMIVLPGRTKIPQVAPGVPDWDAQAAKLEEHHRKCFPSTGPITPRTGALLAEWARFNGQPADAGSSPSPSGQDWAKWGTAVTVRLSKCKTKAQFEEIMSKVNPNLLPYKEWSAEKWADLMGLIAATRAEVDPPADGEQRSLV